MLALGINLLVFLLLIGLGVTPIGKARNDGGPVMINVGPSPKDSPDARKAEPKKERKEQRDQQKPVPPRPQITLDKRAPVIPPKVKADDSFVPMASSDLAAADISKLGSNAPGGVPGDSKPVGVGPNGETLYAAEWVREPTRAEMQTYTPNNVEPGAYARIMCKTAPGNRVDDCVELESVPAHIRLSKALRQAAWQFKIRPPRKNGKPMIGEWVVIRYSIY